MFCEQIDVSKIMMEIKKNVITVEEPNVATPNYLGNDATEYERISTFLVNTRQINYQKCISVGQNVPEYSHYMRPVAWILRFIAKVVRKFIRYVINDQIAVNIGVDSCVKALIEHDDALQKEIIQLKKSLNESNEKINALEKLLLEKK